MEFDSFVGLLRHSDWR